MYSFASITRVEMEAETFSRMLDYNAILKWLIAQEDFTAFSIHIANITIQVLKNVSIVTK
jgi:hypothetical protein